MFISLVTVFSNFLVSLDFAHIFSISLLLFCIAFFNSLSTIKAGALKFFRLVYIALLC